eukprot:COSAG02_NODE_7031_length_3219_cov_1.591987_3_plen_562_part_00
MRTGQPAWYMYDSAEQSNRGTPVSNPPKGSALLGSASPASAALPEQRSYGDGLFALDQTDDFDTTDSLDDSDSLSESLSWDDWHVADGLDESGSEEFLSADESFLLDEMPAGTHHAKSLPPAFVPPDEGLQGQLGQGTSKLERPSAGMQRQFAPAPTSGKFVSPSSNDGCHNDACMDWHGTSSSNPTPSRVKRSRQEQYSLQIAIVPQVTESGLSRSETKKAIRRLADYHRGPNHRATHQTRRERWKIVEMLLLSDDTEAFQQRPYKLTGPNPGPCVFREETTLRRMKNGDRWQNSGGMKGSTVWPPDHPRFRCQYGKVDRQCGAPLRYHAYAYIKEAITDDQETVRNRRIFVVNGSAEVDQAPRNNTPTLLSNQGNRTIFANFDAQLATLQANASNLEETDNLKVLHKLLSDANLHKDLLSCSLRYQRPDLLQTKLGHCIYLETKTAGRSRPRGFVKAFDRWVNSGGKHAVRKLAIDGVQLQRRRGRVVQCNTFNVPTMGKQAARYVQYSAEGSADVRLYHVYTRSSQLPRPETGRVKRQRQLSSEHLETTTNRQVGQCI